MFRRNKGETYRSPNWMSFFFPLPWPMFKRKEVLWGLWFGKRIGISFENREKNSASSLTQTSPFFLQVKHNAILTPPGNSNGEVFPGGSYIFLVVDRNLIALVMFTLRNYSFALQMTNLTKLVSDFICALRGRTGGRTGRPGPPASARWSSECTEAGGRSIWCGLDNMSSGFFLLWDCHRPLTMSHQRLAVSGEPSEAPRTMSHSRPSSWDDNERLKTTAQVGHFESQHNVDPHHFPGLLFIYF